MLVNDRVGPRPGFGVAMLWCLLLTSIGASSLPQDASAQAADSLSVTRIEDAEELANKARAAFKKRGAANLEQSLSLFESALRVDPNLADAEAGASSALCLMALYGYRKAATSMPRAERHARRALALDDSLSEAHGALGLVSFLYRWDWEAAEASFERSLTLHPHNATVLHWYAMMMRATARYDEALDLIERAIAEEPGQALYRVKRGTILLAAGRLEKAARQLDEAIERHPGFAMAVRDRGLVAMEAGKLEAAERFLRRAAELSPADKKNRALVGLVAGLSGDKSAAEALLSEAPSSALTLALIHLGRDQTEAAMVSMRTAFAERDPACVYVARHPGYQKIREHPGFISLLRDAGLPPP